MPDDPRPGSWQERARDLPFRGPLNRDEEEQLELRPARHEADVRPLHPEVLPPEEPEDESLEAVGPAERRCAWPRTMPRRACPSRT